MNPLLGGNPIFAAALGCDGGQALAQLLHEQSTACGELSTAAIQAAHANVLYPELERAVGAELASAWGDQCLDALGPGWSENEAMILEQRWTWGLLPISYLELAVLLGEDRVPRWFGIRARHWYRGQIPSDSISEEAENLPIRDLIVALVRHRVGIRVQSSLEWRDYYKVLRSEQEAEATRRGIHVSALPDTGWRSSVRAPSRTQARRWGV